MLLTVYTQAFIAVVSLHLLNHMLPFIDLKPFSIDIAQKWFPVTALFACMLFTGSMTIAYLTIPIITVFKNLTNLLIAFGDWYFFGQKISIGVLGSFLIMLIGSVLSGLTDMEFSLVGYVWMAGNCASQACYVLYMKRAQKETKLSEWGQAYYNNLLSIGVLGAMAYVNGEFSSMWDFPALTDPLFVLTVVFSGLIGTGLSLSVFWVVKVTSPTSYSMIGSLNKIPITVVSVFLFHTILTWQSTVSLGVGLASGVIYTYAKYQEQVSREASSVKQ